MVKVSVATITYNQERYIATALESILMQRVDFPFEMVIGEDCSTDGTREIVTDFQRRHTETIRLLATERNPGDYGKTNFVRTLQACQGEYIALLEGDDFWTSEDKLQRQADFLNRHADCAFCFHPANVMYEDGSRETSVFPDRTKPFYDLHDLLKGNFIQTCTVMFRRRLLSDFPAWFYSLVMSDYPLHLLNARHGRIGCLDEVMATYRVHPGGVWSMRSRIPGLEETVAFYRHVRSLLSPRDRLTLRTTTAKVLLDLCLEYERSGSLARSRAILWQSFKENPARMLLSAKFRRTVRHLCIPHRGAPRLLIDPTSKHEN